MRVTGGPPSGSMQRLSAGGMPAAPGRWRVISKGPGPECKYRGVVSSMNRVSLALRATCQVKSLESQCHLRRSWSTAAGSLPEATRL